jgi:hypothetical protein
MNRITIPNDLTQSEGFAILRQLEATLGWTGTVATRGDAESVMGREFTDDEWNTLRETKAWRTYIPDAMWDAASEMIADVTHRVLPGAFEEY